MPIVLGPYRVPRLGPLAKACTSTFMDLDVKFFGREERDLTMAQPELSWSHDPEDIILGKARAISPSTAPPWLALSWGYSTHVP